MNRFDKNFDHVEFNYHCLRAFIDAECDNAYDACEYLDELSDKQVIGDFLSCQDYRLRDSTGAPMVDIRFILGQIYDGKPIMQSIRDHYITQRLIQKYGG